MTGPEVLDVARDAIITLVIVVAPVMLVGLVVGVVDLAVAGADANPGNDARLRAEDPGDLRLAADRAAVHGGEAARRDAADRRAHRQRGERHDRDA